VEINKVFFRIVRNHPFATVAVILLIIGLGYAAGYFMVEKSGAYKAAKQIIPESPYVISMVGKPVAVSVDVLGGNRLTFGPNSDSAHICITATGPFGHLRLHLYMKKENFGSWRIVRARSNGSNVNLFRNIEDYTGQ
jgi:hypothetical protein